MVCGRGEVGEPVPGGESLLVPVNHLMHATHKVFPSYTQCVYTNTHCVYINTDCVYTNTDCVYKYTLCV